MAKLTILEYPDPRLRTKAAPVERVGAELGRVIDDMFETMYAAPGIGLAATQVDYHKRVVVLDVSEDKSKPLVLINPEIVAAEGKQRNEEGCLSFPEIGAPITRADTVTVTFLDLEGCRQTVTARGLLSRAIQHETDHLNGVLLVDRMSPMQRMSVSGQLKRLQKKI